MYRPTLSRVPLKTKDYSAKQFDHNYSTDTDCEEGTGTSRIGRGHWVTDVCYCLSELQVDALKLTRLMSCGVQSVSDFRRLARYILGKTMEFPDLKINTSKYRDFGGSCM